MASFKSCAWRDWTPPDANPLKKTRPPKVRQHSIKNGELTHPTHPKNEAVPPPKSEHNELLPIYAANDGVVIPATSARPDDNLPTGYSRERDDDLPVEEWHEGEAIKRPINIKPKDKEIERVRDTRNSPYNPLQ
jgi:hypothetical protein